MKDCAQGSLVLTYWEQRKLSEALSSRICEVSLVNGVEAKPAEKIKPE